MFEIPPRLIFSNNRPDEAVFFMNTTPADLLIAIIVQPTNNSKIMIKRILHRHVVYQCCWENGLNDFGLDTR